MHSLIDDIFAEMAATYRLPILRKRNRKDDSLTMSKLRPDFMLLVRDTLLFKMEDKPISGSIGAAITDLLTKMKKWSDAYHGKIEYLLCAAAAGYKLQ